MVRTRSYVTFILHRYFALCSCNAHSLELCYFCEIWPISSSYNEGGVQLRHETSSISEERQRCTKREVSMPDSKVCNFKCNFKLWFEGLQFQMQFEFGFEGLQFGLEGLQFQVQTQIIIWNCTAVITSSKCTSFRNYSPSPIPCPMVVAFPHIIHVGRAIEVQVTIVIYRWYRFISRYLLETEREAQGFYAGFEGF